MLRSQSEGIAWVKCWGPGTRNGAIKRDELENLAYRFFQL
jgi:hypothetical protein